MTAPATARRIVDAHMAGLNARRSRDLLSEKLMLHIDGTGDAQYADIFMGTRVEIPRTVSEFRKSENILRLLVDNAVAHHTTMPLHYAAKHTPDRRGRDTAMIDSILINHVARQQRFNSLFAEALYLSMATGFCPVHVYWRDGVVDGYEAAGPGGGVAPGMMDCFVGNPFDHVFDRGSRKGSIYSQTYGRMLPASLVRQTFANVPGAAGLQGTTRIPSASNFQRIARQWQSAGLGVHGSGILDGRRAVKGEFDQDEGDELIALLCREVLPGIDPNWPMGRLQLVAVPGTTDFRIGRAQSGHALLLYDAALPAGDFSSSLVYSHHRGDDVLGKPWTEDMDEMQVQLNILISKRDEHIQKMADAPIVAPGGLLSEDMATIDAYSVLEIEPGMASFRPEVMQWPDSILAGLDKAISEKRQALYTHGGYQAVSRGESPGSRTAYRAIVALQQADNTIHGPVNQRFQETACDFGQRCWKQFKVYGSIPWLVDVTGDEFAHMAEPYIDNTKLSAFPPDYSLVNGFGSSPELRAQEIIELCGTQGADGQPFLTTAEARRNYPNQMIFDTAGDPAAVARRRAKTVANKFIHLAREYRDATGITGQSMDEPDVQKAGQILFITMEQRYRRLRDDDLAAHIATLTEIIQDETADAIARVGAVMRQDLYYQWQMQMAMGGQPADASGKMLGAGGQKLLGPGGQTPKPTIDRQGIAAEHQSGGAAGGAEHENTRSKVSMTAR